MSNNYMRLKIKLRYFPLLLLAGLLWTASATIARAATWEWSPLQGRERLAITFDNAEQQVQARRTDRDNIRIAVQPGVQDLNMQGPAPSSSSLVDRLLTDQGNIDIKTKNPAFGFIVTLPSPGRMNIDVYPDEIGERWRTPGPAVPEPVIPEPAAAPAISVPPQETSPAPQTPSEPAAPTEASAESPDELAAPSAITTDPVETQVDPAVPPVTVDTQNDEIPLSDSDLPAEPVSESAENVPVLEPVPAVAPQAPSTQATEQQTPPPAPSGQSAPASSPYDSEAPAVGEEMPGIVPDSQPVSPGVPDPGNVQTAPEPDIVPTQAPESVPVTIPTPQPPETPVQNQPAGQTNTLPGPDSQPDPLPPSPPAIVSGNPALPQQDTTTPAAVPVPPATTPSSPKPATEPDSQTSGLPAPPSVPPVEPQSVTRTPQLPTKVEVVIPPNAPGPELRVQINHGGPENIPEEQTLSFSPAKIAEGSPVWTEQPLSEQESIATTTPDGSQEEPQANTEASPAPEQPVQPAAEPESDPESDASVQPDSPTENQPDGNVSEPEPQAENTETQEVPQIPELEPIYKDEQGNIIPRPPDIPAMVDEMRNRLKQESPDQVLPLIAELKGLSLPVDQREEVLYNYMTALYEQYRPDFVGTADEVISAANEAMNYNLHSPRVPDALAVLIAVDLAMDNIEEASGYVSLMRQSYPMDPNVPTSLLNLGTTLMENADYAAATEAFQTIVQEYPESIAAKDASRQETYALYNQGHLERALTLLEFVDRRWPQIHLEDPNYLSMAADIRAKEGKYPEAISTYWIQYNLAPTEPSAATTLKQIAELYFKVDDKISAAQILEKLLESFQASQEVPVALRWLGENGIFDGNLSVDELLAMFSQPNPRLPSIYYQRIINDFPGTDEAKTAELRATAWLYWNKEYNAAMNSARSFLIDYDGTLEAERAMDVLMRSFAWEIGIAQSEENFDRILSLWERFPQVQEFYQPLEPDLRIALARAQINRGQEEAGLELLAPFLEDGGDVNYGMYTYNLFLNHYLRTGDWNGVLNLADKVSAWPLDHDTRLQLDYSTALAAQQMDLPGLALPLWQKLAPRTDIPLYERAYATYYLARDAERRQDIRDAYQYNLDTLGMFSQLQDELSPFSDPERIRESIAALMEVTETAGRYAEALEWHNQYSLFVPMDSPDYAGLRFREARLHRKMGDMLRWQSILQGIVDKEPDSVFGELAASELRTHELGRDLSRYASQ